MVNGTRISEWWRKKRFHTCVYKNITDKTTCQLRRNRLANSNDGQPQRDRLKPAKKNHTNSHIGSEIGEDDRERVQYLYDSKCATIVFYAEFVFVGLGEYTYTCTALLGGTGEWIACTYRNGDTATISQQNSEWNSSNSHVCITMYSSRESKANCTMGVRLCVPYLLIRYFKMYFSCMCV